MTPDPTLEVAPVPDVGYRPERFIPVSEPTVEDDDVAAVAEVMRTRWLSTGPRVLEYEKVLSEMYGMHAVSVSSCTAALFLSLKGLGIGPGDRVGVPAITFAATAAVVEHVGARVEFVDVEPDTWMLDPERAQSLLGRLTAIIVVDLYGNPYPRCLIEEYKRAGLIVIEDAAHAIGARLSSAADSLCFSTYATKNAVTCGEGGAVLTKHEALAEYVQTMRLHGLDRDAWKRYSAGGRPDHGVMAAGYKANLTDVQAAMGLSQLAKLSRMRDARIRLAERYDKALDGLVWPAPLRPRRSEDGIPHLYPISLSALHDRDEVIERLRVANIGAGIHYRCLPCEPYWAEQNRGRSWPTAETIGATTLSLPLFAHLRACELEYIVQTITKILEEGR